MGHAGEGVGRGLALPATSSSSEPAGTTRPRDLVTPSAALIEGRNKSNERLSGVPNVVTNRGVGGRLKGTPVRRQKSARGELFHLPKLVMRAVTVAPTLLPRCNACNFWAVVILLLA